MNLRKKITFYSLYFFILIVVLEIILFFFLNWQWNLKKRPLGAENNTTKYYQSFHPLFRNLSNLSADLITYDKHLPYRLKSNSFLFRDYGENNLSTIEVDNFGFSHNGDKNYNKNFFKNKGKKEKRILFLGGSTTFGTGASDNTKTYPAQVAKIYSQHTSHNKFKASFLNAGVIGYKTPQELLYLKHHLIKLDPDILIFLDGSNDAHISLTQKTFDRKFHPMQIKEKDNKKNLFSFPQKLYLLNFLSRFYYKIKVNLNKISFFKTANLKSYYHEEASIEMKKNINEIIKFVNQKEIKIIFYLQPNLFIKNSLTISDKKKLLSLETRRPGFKENMKKYHKDFQKIYKELQKDHSNNNNILFKDISNLFLDSSRYKFSYQSWAHFDDIGYNSLANIIANDIQILLNN